MKKFEFFRKCTNRNRVNAITYSIICSLILFSPLTAFAAHSWCKGIEKDKTFNFEWKFNGDPQDGEGVMLVKNSENNKIIQKLEGKTYYSYNEENEEEIVERIDLNFDGCSDIRWEESSGASGNTNYAVFLFNQKNGIFNFSNSLSNIVGLEVFDIKNKCLIGSSSAGADESNSEIHCWINDRLVQKGFIDTTWNENKGCYLHKRYVIQHGKSKLVSKTCTQEKFWRN